MFHRVAKELLSSDSACGLASVLREQEPSLKEWKSVLRTHAYDQLFGRLLTQQNAVLQGSGTQVLNAWTALQHLTDWLCDVWWEITEQGTKECDASEWFQTEQPLVCEFNRSGWPEPVVLLGQSDAILRHPKKDCRCVIEWKTGATSPEVDLLQACLYHYMLHPTSSNLTSSAIAVVSFRPTIEEVCYSATQVNEIRERLLDLVEQMAQVHWQKTPVTAPVASKVTTEQLAKPVTAIKPEGVPVALPESPNSIIVTPTEPPQTEQPMIDRDWQREKAKQIVKVLGEMNSPSREIREPSIGPTFIRFYFYPEKGVTASKVLRTGGQLQLRLALEREPVMSLADGAVAIDIPNPVRQSLPFSSVKEHLPKLDPLVGNASVPVGKDLKGAWKFCDLSDSESSHMLVVGTPGSGKSEWLRVALASLMVTNTAETLQLLLIDPKRNAFCFAEGSPMLRAPIVVPNGSQDTSEILSELVTEMEERNQLLQSTHSKTLKDHIRVTGQPAKRVIVICDEYAALLDGASKGERQQIEMKIKQLAQLGRAPGFHLILATQQPRANIVTPAIRSLLPAKIALRVTDAKESRIAIEERGAEQLLGRGDLLFKCIGLNRYQSAFLSTEEEGCVADLVASGLTDGALVFKL